MRRRLFYRTASEHEAQLAKELADARNTIATLRECVAMNDAKIAAARQRIDELELAAADGAHPVAVDLAVDRRLKTANAVAVKLRDGSQLSSWGASEPIRPGDRININGKEFVVQRR